MASVQNPAAVLLFCGALAAFLLLVTVFVRCPGTGIALLMAGQFVMIAFGLPTADVGGLDLSVVDVLVAAAMVAVAVNAAVYPRNRLGLHRMLLLFVCVVVLVSLLTGVAVHGLQTAGNDARVGFLYVFGAALYVVTVKPSRDLSVVVLRIWTAVAAGYALSAVVWWSKFGVGSSSSQVLVGGHLVSGRGIPASAALFIAQAAVMWLVLRGTRPRALLVMVPLLFAVLLLQHRSAWMATGAMLVAWLLLCPERRARKVITGGVAVLAVITAVFVAAAMPSVRLTGDLAESASNGSTWQWRVMGWRQLIGQLHGVSDWLFGFSFGSGYDRFMGNIVTGLNPHSFYVLMLLRVGLLGIALLSLLVVTSLRSCGRRTSVGLLMWLLAAGEVAFSLTYEPSLPDGVLLGLLVRCATESAARRTRALPEVRIHTPPPAAPPLMTHQTVVK